jgi:cobalt/nickel transport system ATP-binding protein
MATPSVVPLCASASKPVQESIPGVADGKPGPAIELVDLSFSYPDGRRALDGIDLVVHAQEKVALVGRNGAGKSTLLLHLNGILTGQGAVRIMGNALNHGNLGSVRSQVGLVFQHPDDQLFSPTVFEDVAFGPLHMNLDEEEVNRRVRWALAEVGMDGFEHRMSHHLSLGEKKRIAIATVLAMRPAILALDEPSGELDPRARRGLIRLLGSLPQTVVVATHDIRLVEELLPRTVIMDGGRVVADGPTHVLLKDVELLDRHGLEPP